MEIVELGVPPDDKEYEARCLHCRTLVRFRRSEAEEHPDRNGSYLAVRCPVCRHDITAEC